MSPAELSKRLERVIKVIKLNAIALELLAYSFAKLLPAIINLLVIFLLANFYDHTQYGVYILLFATVSSLNSLLFHWIRIRAVNVSAASGYKFMEEAAVTSFYIVVLVCASVSTILPIFFSIDLVVVILVSVVAQSYFELSLELSRLRFAAKEFLIMSVARAFLTLTIVAISLLIHSYVDARVLMLLV